MEIVARDERARGRETGAMTALDEFLQSRLPATLDFLREMVGINSFTANREGVNRLGRFTVEAFTPLGFTAESVPSVNPNYGDHLVLTRRGHSPKSIAMVSHLDTVFSPEEEAAFGPALATAAQAVEAALALGCAAAMNHINRSAALDCPDGNGA